ncbi:MAG: outer membrane beta-barrel protein [Tannerella sp.]|nr:outer membrane beta-barrel protein [Tannerella sp.]
MGYHLPYYLFLALFGVCPLLTAQIEFPQADRKKKHNIRIGFEAGVDSYFSDIKKPAPLREFNSEPVGQYGSFYNEANQTFMSTGVGIKPEFFFGKNRWGISTGLRFSRYLTTLEPRHDAFYWMNAQEGLLTDYLTICKFSQKSYYLGIPLEMRFFTNRRDLPFQIYFKIGSTFNCRLSTDNEVVFKESSMEKYAGAVDEKIGKPDRFHVYIYPAIGFKIGKYGKGYSSWYNLEFHVPGILLQSNVSSFSKSKTGLGAGFTVQIPLGRMAPIGSN